MGMLSLKQKVCILISWALVLMCSTAKRDYFFRDWGNLTWDEARSHCRVCFDELVTLTPENIQTVSQMITSDCWVGLRKNINSTSNSSKAWSRWANGDPLIFQNWYPGWPVLKSSSCSAVATAPTTTSISDFSEAETANVTYVSSFTSVTDHAVASQAITSQTVTDQTVASQAITSQTVTDQTVASQAITSQTVTDQTVASQILTDQTVTDQSGLGDCVKIDDNYIEDSCVAMLSFGAWIEMNCLERLSFICYEERFLGQVNVTNRRSDSATLKWLTVADISHYHVVVKTDNITLMENQTNSLTYDLADLTAGTGYSVQVFPVKCNRKLNPQEILFYTKPNKVENLEVTGVTETSAVLSWNKPAGNVDFYLIEVLGGQQILSNTEVIEVSSLTPGNLYTFIVLAGVRDNSTWSEVSNTTKYTKPGKVSDLRLSKTTNNSELLKWEPPEGNTTGFRVTAMNCSDNVLYNEDVNQTQATIPELPLGTEIIFSVAALTDSNTLEGEKVTLVKYTDPGMISDLILVSSGRSINATWEPVGSFTSFTVKLQLDGKNVETIHNLTTPRKDFDRLKTAANYTVIVYTISGDLRSQPVEDSIFTTPSPPTNATVISAGKNEITFHWNAPEDIATAKYVVKIKSIFWGHNKSDTLVNKTSYTFGDLESGTRYDFEVRTVSNGEESDAATTAHFTVAEKREISLSMLCSSAQSLLCDNNATEKSVVEQLRKHFDELLGDSIFWEFEKQESEKTKNET